MPRKPRDFKRDGPAIAPGDDEPDTGAAAQRHVLLTRAGAAPMAAAPGTPRSAFDAVPPPAPTGTVIHRGKPIPPRRTGKVSGYIEVYESLAIGDCAEYPDKQAAAMVSALKKHELPHTVRRLSDTTKGIWRTAPAAPFPITK